MIRGVTAGIVAGLLVLAIAIGVSFLPTAPASPDHVSEQTVYVVMIVNNQRVPCLVYQDSAGAGMSCDWEGFRP